MRRPGAVASHTRVDNPILSALIILSILYQEPHLYGQYDDRQSLVVVTTDQRYSLSRLSNGLHHQVALHCLL